MIRFEKNGAPGLDEYFQHGSPDRFLLPSEGTPPSQASVGEIEMDLLEHHFRNCLLVHVAGFGQKKVGQKQE